MLPRIGPIIEDLTSTDPVIRFSASNRLENLSWTPEEIREFERVRDAIDCPETKFLLRVFLQKIEEKGSGAFPSTGRIEELNKILNADPPDFLRLSLILEELSPTDFPAALCAVRDFGFSGFPEEVLPAVFRVIKNHGSAADIPAIEEYCRHPNPIVLSAAVEVIERISPGDLKPLLGPLLAHSIPGVQSKAVRLLHKWNPEEALRLFQSMMFSSNPSERQAGLFIGIFFPFSQIESLLLRFVRKETHLPFVRAAGRLFTINPSFPTALSLVEIFDNSIGEKKAILKESLLGIAEFLSKAGLTEKTPAETLEELKKTYLAKKTGSEPQKGSKDAKISDNDRTMVGKSEDDLENDDPGIVLATVEALKKADPEKLVPLLAHESGVVRSYAIRLLYKWDPEEAVKHFEGALFSSDVAEREAALHQAYFFPFQAIEPLLFRFLGIEDDLNHLKKAGYLFQVNPVVGEPLRLIEILETSSGEKKALIDSILHGVVQALSKSGLVKKSPEAILAELQRECAERKTRIFIDQSRVFLSSPIEEERRMAIHWLGLLAESGVGEAGTLLGNHLSLESDEGLKDQIMASLATGTKGPVETKTSLEHYSSEELMQWLRGARMDDFLLHRLHLLGLLEKGGSSEKREVARLISQYGSLDDAQSLKKLLPEADDDCAEAFVRALAKIDCSLLDSHFSKLLRRPGSAVKEAAVQAFILRDKKQALANVEQWLGSVKPSERAMAIFTLGHFDFSSVMELAVSVFFREPNPQNRDQLKALLLNHPSEVLFRKLVLGFGEVPGPERPYYQNVIGELASLLSSKFPDRFASPDILLEQVPTILKADEESRKAPSPYSLGSIKKIRNLKEQKKNPPSPPESVNEIVSRLREILDFKFAAGLGFILFLITGFLTFGPFFGEENFNPETGVKLFPSQLKKVFLEVGETASVKGIVQEISPAGVLVALPESGERVLIKTGSPTINLRNGDTFQGSVQVTARKRQRYEAFAR